MVQNTRGPLSSKWERGSLIMYPQIAGWGREYCVDGVSGASTNSGLDWGHPLDTIANAITASNTYIALTANANKHNRILVGGGIYTESLTVMPYNCDVIGVGHRNGWKSLLSGVQTFATLGTNSRFINLHFHNTTSAPVITVPAGSHGYGFIDCMISDGGTSTHGLDITDSYDGEIRNCVFNGNPPCPIGISFAGTSCGGTQVIGNTISATTIGIEVENGMTADYGLVIASNYIFRSDPNTDSQLAEGIAFQETQGRSHAMVINNWISAADAIVFDGTYSGNRDSWMCCANYVNQGASATTEDKFADVS